MEVEDRKGLLAAVSAKIADINTNIRNMEAHTDDDRHARIDVTVEISDLKHLERVIKSLRGVDGVLDVERAGGRRYVRSRRRAALRVVRRRSRRFRFGRRAADGPTCTVARAGRGSLKHAAYTSLNCGEVVHVGEEHRRPNDVVERQPGRLEQRAEVVEDAACLDGDVTLDHLAGRGIDRNLTRHEEELSRRSAGE